MRSLRTALALSLASAALAACSDQPNSAPTDPSRPRVTIPAAVNGAVLTLPACDFTQLKSDSRAYTKSNDALLTIAGDLQSEVGKRGRTRAATNLVLDGLARIAAIRGTTAQNSDITALVFDRLVRGWLACGESDLTSGALEPTPPPTTDGVGGFGPALGSHWVFEVRGKNTDPPGGAYERNKPPVGTTFWAAEPGESDWAASIGGSFGGGSAGLHRVFIYGYQIGNDAIPAKFGSSFEHRTIPTISSTFTLSAKVGLCGVNGLGTGRRVDHDNVFLPLESNFQCSAPAPIDAASSIYAFHLLNPISLAQRAMRFLGPQQLHAALGTVVGSRPKGLSPSAVYDLSQYQFSGLGTISDGKTSEALHLVSPPNPPNTPITLFVSVPGPNNTQVAAPVGTPVAVSIVGNNSVIAFFTDGPTGPPTPTVTRYVGANGIVSFANVFVTKSGVHMLGFRVSLANASGGVDFQGANVITSNNFNIQNK